MSKFNWFNSLRYRLTFFFGGISLIFCLGFTSYLSSITSDKLLNAYANQLTMIGRSIETTISNNIDERAREISLLSKRALFSGVSANYPQIRQNLDNIKTSYEYYSWLGFADINGVVKYAADGTLEGHDVSKRPWFINGKTGVFIGDVHDAVLLAKVLNIDKNDPLRLIDFAAPVFDTNNNLLGVVATHSNWKWVNTVIESALARSQQQTGIDVQIVSRDDGILYPQASADQHLPQDLLPKDNSSQLIQWPDGHEYLTGVTTLKSTLIDQLGWRIVVRIPKNIALQEITELQRQLLWVSVIAVLLCLWFVYRMSISMSLPLERLITVTREIQAGKEQVKFPKSNGLIEISFLIDAIQKMTFSLLSHEKSLVEMNQTLENKVLERTKELESANQELERLSRRDPLTDLHNRRSAAEHIDSEFTRLKRFGLAYSILMVDIDHFKKINDTYGHETGDIVLVEVAKLLAQSVRKADLVARYGGEEFLIILTGTDSSDALTLAEKIRASINTTEFTVVKNVTASIGLSTVEQADETAYDVVRRADTALYLAKTTGRNKVCT
ncbi:sensor domain-containing diguanylate cyclase [Shewanella mangrovisoli]|uniref:sensor domain-containing diguanylate cyclase n=1 Tax=Shewanella mangrovisoli TaxID=2864211 RepID=UPI001C659B0E|nr:sensor domain-containing diguanylate cyclase [Shewanella mangrovisoli]QYK08536.1 diguanylate cyclase [Shewanella mangrovisoli]